ncbi:MAG TPA: eIF2A-related protein, partial [Elainellaceae cyanobacterium]
MPTRRYTKRYRGVLLSVAGWEKLQARISQLENEENERYTPTKISQKSQLIDSQGLHPATVRKILRRQVGVDESSIRTLFRVFGVEITSDDYVYSHPNLSPDEQAQTQFLIQTSVPESLKNWTSVQDAPDISTFSGRTHELTILEQWAVLDRCRLIAILGMGGMGKTSLAVKLFEQVRVRFEYIVWQSLQDAPPLTETIKRIIQTLDAYDGADLPDSSSKLISQLLGYLRSHRCLIILDNFDTVLGRHRSAPSLINQSLKGEQYHLDYKEYSQFLKRVGESQHQSCLILTSRERPEPLVELVGATLPVRSLRLKGLSGDAAKDIFHQAGYVNATDAEWEHLIETYNGNPLALKIVSKALQELFDGNVREFLQQGQAVFGGIRDFLKQEFDQLSSAEKDLMYWLAINREPVSLQELLADVLPSLSGHWLDGVDSLLGRSLIEKRNSRFTLQPVVMEYVTDFLIEQIYQELKDGDIQLFSSHALIKTTVKDYIREGQRRLILQPIANQLHTNFSPQALERQISLILKQLRNQSNQQGGYGTGNLINLCAYLNIDLTGYDFSDLPIWHADLQYVNLRRVNFSHAQFAKSAFTQPFGSVLTVAYSPDGRRLATGDSSGEVRLWGVADGQPQLICRGHSNWVWSIAWSADGRSLASGGDDQTVCIWNTRTGQCDKTLRGHSSLIWSVAWSPDRRTLASGSQDQTIRLWDIQTGRCLTVLKGHTHWVWSVAWSPDGQTLASGGQDQTIRLWDIQTGRCLTVLKGHTHWVWSVAWSPDGQTLASSSDDHTVKLWDIRTKQCVNTLHGASSGVHSVAFSPDGKTLTGGSCDKSVRLWDTQTGTCLKTLLEHDSCIHSVAFSPDGETLASGSHDQTVRIWDTQTGQRLKTLLGYINSAYSVVFSPDGRLLASGSQDQSVRLWNPTTGQCIRTLQGHTSWVSSVAFSPDRQHLASGSYNHRVRLWDIHTGQCIKALQGHTDWVSSVTFSPDGKILASGSADQTVRLWDTTTGECMTILQGHSNWVLAVAFSPDGQILASSGADQTICLWNLRTRQCMKHLHGHLNWVWSVAFSPVRETSSQKYSQILASSGHDDDPTVRLWDVETGHCWRVLQGHTNSVMSLSFSPDGRAIATCSDDQTIRLWSIDTGKCLKMLQGHSDSVTSVAFSPDGQYIVASHGTPGD